MNELINQSGASNSRKRMGEENVPGWTLLPHLHSLYDKAAKLIPWNYTLPTLAIPYPLCLCEVSKPFWFYEPISVAGDIILWTALFHKGGEILYFVHLIDTMVMLVPLMQYKEVFVVRFYN